MEEWKATFDEALTRGSVIEMIEVLQSQATAHAGTANAQVKRTAIKRVQRYYDSKPEECLRVALDFCRSTNPTAEEVGVHLSASCYSIDPNAIAIVLHDLADSHNWEVREWVADACGTILEAHFDAFYPTMKSWSRDESENVRRAVVLAMMYAGKSRQPEFADPILDALEGLLPDRSKYVRDNLGPFAIGHALIKYYPEQVLERIHRWVRSENEQVRWNVAMVFSAAGGAHYAIDAGSVLATLSLDERPYVQRAMAKAMKNVRQRCPEFVDGQGGTRGDE